LADRTDPPTTEGETVTTIVMTLNRRKPRNPFVATSLRRRAGAHRSTGGARRLQAKAALRREIERLKPSP
jgi:hypothetical protein